MSKDDLDESSSRYDNRNEYEYSTYHVESTLSKLKYKRKSKLKFGLAE
jgi:hypothetical protein